MIKRTIIGIAIFVVGYVCGSEIEQIAMSDDPSTVIEAGLYGATLLPIALLLFVLVAMSYECRRRMKDRFIDEVPARDKPKLLVLYVYRKTAWRTVGRLMVVVSAVGFILGGLWVIASVGFTEVFL